MLSCLVDGENYAFESAASVSLENVVEMMQGAASEKGRIIASFLVNGGDLDADGSGQWSTDGGNRIEITTGTPAELAVQLLNQGSEHLVDLLGALGQTVGFYRSGNQLKGGESFIDLINGLELISNLTTISASALQVSLAEACFDGSSLNDRVGELNRILLEIMSCQERQDYVFLTDLLEYELAPQLVRWQEIYALLQKLQ